MIGIGKLVKNSKTFQLMCFGNLFQVGFQGLRITRDVKNIVVVLYLLNRIIIQT